MEASKLVAAAGILIGFAFDSANEQPNSYGVVLSGPGFLASLGNLPSDRLVSFDATDSSVTFMVREEWQAGEAEVRVFASSTRPISNEIEASVEGAREQIFRDSASELCNGVVEFSRTVLPPAPAADGAMPARLEAICRAPRDQRWSMIHLISEVVRSGPVTCLWDYRLSTGTPSASVRPPVQDVCTTMDAPERGGSISVRIVPSGRED